MDVEIPFYTMNKKVDIKLLLSVDTNIIYIQKRIALSYPFL